MSEESIHETIKRIMSKIAPNPNRPLYVSLCPLLDKLAVLKITYDIKDDIYDIDYEDGRKDKRNIIITRKEIKDVCL